MDNTEIVDKLISEMRGTCFLQSFNPTNQPIKDETVLLEKVKNIPDLNATNKDGNTLLICACIYKMNQIVTYLIQNGSDINHHGIKGFTALHAALDACNHEAVFLLLEHGADPNARDAYGNSALLRASHLAPDEVFVSLMDCGADPYQKNNYGICPMKSFEAYPRITTIMSK